MTTIVRSTLNIEWKVESLSSFRIVLIHRPKQVIIQSVRKVGVAWCAMQ